MCVIDYNEVFETIITDALGFERDDFGFYMFPLNLKYYPEILERIEKLASKYNVQIPFHGRSKILLLRLKKLTTKQLNNLLNQGLECVINVKFEFFSLSKGEVTYSKVLEYQIEEVEEEEDLPDGW